MLSVSVMNDHGYEGWGVGGLDALKQRISQALQRAEELLKSGLEECAHLMLMSAISDLHLAGLEHVAEHDDLVMLSAMESDEVYGPIIGQIKEMIQKHGLLDQMNSLAIDLPEHKDILRFFYFWKNPPNYP